MSKIDNMGFSCVLRAWQAYRKELFAFLLYRIGDRYVAEDLLQDVFLKSVRLGQSFCTLDNPRAWLFQVARHALIDFVRLDKSQEMLSENLVAAPGSERLPVDELDVCIGRNLRELKIEDRHIISVCDFQGLSVRAYGEANGLALAAAKSRLLRARKRLREQLIQNCQVRFDEATGRVCCYVPRS